MLSKSLESATRSFAGRPGERAATAMNEKPKGILEFGNLNANFA